MLSPVTYDFGHVEIATPRLTHTGGPAASPGPSIHPQRRLFSRPAFRHASHFQPAWLENWKWKATVSFFFPLR